MCTAHVDLLQRRKLIESKSCLTLALVYMFGALAYPGKCCETRSKLIFLCIFMVWKTTCTLLKFRFHIVNAAMRYE